ncbi:hypothetical protein FGO68_gene8219 [Halteria grandinella]|uniref:Cyclic nucleotide-binding domain-containing protein n=1 Tax=Halteria grandinella TaxID=5974 RepID=A0A8J8P1J4_HALGN|nr:hypothetical protein FGO68_gene8219 [Halteria grandinella]
MPQFRVDQLCTQSLLFQRFRRAGENVVLEGMGGEYLYFTKKGMFASQKAVRVDSVNFWPKNHLHWQSQEVERQVLFTANRIGEGKYFGEQELIDKNRPAYQVNICSAERDSILMMVSRGEVMKLFSEQELGKIRQLRLVEFPSEEEIKARILVIEKVMNMKKNAFLNATNTNFLPAAMRDFYLDPVTKKLYKWVQGIQQRTQAKLNNAIQQKPSRASTSNQDGQQQVFHDEKERRLLMPAGDEPFKVVSSKKRTYNRTQYKKMTGWGDQTKNKIAEGVIEKLINEVAFK